MPIDFKKLNDPVWREEQRKLREAEEAEREAIERQLRDAVDICLDAHESLSEAERSLVRNCRMLLNTFRTPSEKQQKWLLDIAKKHQPKSEAV